MTQKPSLERLLINHLVEWTNNNTVHFKTIDEWLVYRKGFFDAQECELKRFKDLLADVPQAGDNSVT